jgi:hypothetical protein
MSWTSFNFNKLNERERAVTSMNYLYESYLKNLVFGSCVSSVFPFVFGLTVLFFWWQVPCFAGCSRFSLSSCDSASCSHFGSCWFLPLSLLVLFLSPTALSSGPLLLGLGARSLSRWIFLSSLVQCSGLLDSRSWISFLRLVFCRLPVLQQRFSLPLGPHPAVLRFSPAPVFSCSWFLFARAPERVCSPQFGLPRQPVRSQVLILLQDRSSGSSAAQAANFGVISSGHCGLGAITFSHFAIAEFCCCRSVSALGFPADTERLRLASFVGFSFLIVYGLL